MSFIKRAASDWREVLASPALLLFHLVSLVVAIPFVAIAMLFMGLGALGRWLELYAVYKGDREKQLYDWVTRYL